ncbi:hypothetical protein IFR04_008774 [Cadophora malorum]|uniref:Uncharacterized protein n=1 Tax=Cadophora malorum TaxID=108018 RepID=A0A8H7TFZ1_9HELO|nr:hypothetical protein IFR04_008774 [Cadophora malorum]
MPFPAPVLRPDPRLKHRIAYYNRNEIVADLVSFYEFLPHVITSTVHVAPAEGWSEITLASLAVHGIHKTSEVVELLRHLPYLSGDKPWIMIVAMACDYRQVIVSPIAREKPGWMFDAADKQWPAWVIQLTAGTDLEGSHYMPDTTDGNISRHCVGGRFDYPPTYVSEDARSWRDRECDPETVSLREWLEQWREQYLQMTVVTLPPDVLSYGSVDPFFGALEAAPSSYYFEEVDVT